jgi:hypothetical protein
LDVLYEGLEISKLQFLIKKRFHTKVPAVFFLTFLVIKALDPNPYSLELLDLVPDSIDPDPQHCTVHRYTNIAKAVASGTYVVYLLCVIVIATKNDKLRSRFG